MNSFSQAFERVSSLLELTAQEYKRCILLEDAWASTDSEIADACQHDAGALWACRSLLLSMQSGEDLLTGITCILDVISERNNERWEQ